MLLQFVASGALGNRAFEGGLRTASLGLFFHFVVAFVWASIYFFLSKSAPELLEHPWLFGALYGIFVHLMMSRVIVPMSRAPKRPFTWSAWLTQLAIHMTFVGVPIATVQAAVLR
jgi:uncharacterized membrane protein YagU involved in acid resistance